MNSDECLRKKVYIRVEQSVGDNIAYYENALGAKSFMFVLLGGLNSGFPTM